MNHNIVYLSVKFSAGAATFEYDAKGRQVMSAYGSGLSTIYNLLDLPQRHTTGDGTVVDYKYAFDGRKLQEKVTAGTSVTLRDYSGGGGADSISIDSLDGNPVNNVQGVTKKTLIEHSDRHLGHFYLILWPRCRNL